MRQGYSQFPQSGGSDGQADMERLDKLQRAVDAIEQRVGQMPRAGRAQTGQANLGQAAASQTSSPRIQPYPPYPAGALGGSVLQNQNAQLASQAAPQPLEAPQYGVATPNTPAPNMTGQNTMTTGQAASTASELSMLANEIANRQHMLNQTAALQAAVQQQMEQGKASKPQPAAPARPSFTEAKLDNITRTLSSLQGELAGLKKQVSRPVVTQKTVEQHEIDRIARAVAQMQQSSTLDEEAFKRIHKELEDLRSVMNQDLRRAVRREIATSNGNQANDYNTRLDARMDALQEQFEALSQNFNRASLQTANAVSPRVESLASQVDALQSTVEDLPQALSLTSQTTAISRLEDHLGEVMAKMEMLNEQQSALQEWTQNAGAPQEGGVSAEDIASIEGRLDEVARALVAVSNANTKAAPQPMDLSGISRLEERMADLAGMLDEISARDTTTDLQNIAVRIDGLNDRLGSFEKYAENGDLGGASAMFASPDVGVIEEQLRQINEQMTRNAAQTQTSHLEEQLQRLTMRFEEAASIHSTGAQISNLEAQIGQIIRHLNKNDGAAAGGASVDLSPMEARLGQIESQLMNQQSFSLEAAQQAAQQAVALMGANSEPAQIITALSQDLRALQEAADAGNAQTYQSVADMQGMLGQVVDRLATIEDSIAASNTGDGPAVRHGVVQPSSPVDHAMQQTNFAANALGDAARREAMQVASPALDPAGDIENAMHQGAMGGVAAGGGVFDTPPAPFNPSQDAPLEPGSMAPDMHQMVQNASAELHETKARLDGEVPGVDETYQGGFDVPPPLPEGTSEPGNLDGVTEDGRPDAVAAARRALQATTAEMNAVRDEAKGDKKSGAGGKLPKLDMGRLRKPLVMGAAALLLAIVAFQGASMFMGGDKKKLAKKQPAAIEQVAKKAEPKAAPAAAKKDAASAAQGASQETQQVARATRDVTPPASGALPNAQAPAAPSAAPKSAAAAVPAAGDTLASPGLEQPAQGQDAQAAPQPAAAPAPQTTSAGIEVPASAGSRALVAAASSGDPKALFQVGMRYSDGTDVKRNMTESARYFTAAAEKGFAPAQYSIGSLYEKGIGVERDVAKAAQWYEKAADQGNARAMHNLAVIHAMGNPPAIQPNMDRAVGWFQKAADYGIKDSQFNLGILYGQGMGVPQNLSESYKWFALAAKTGDSDAAAKRDEVANAMDPDDLADARVAVNSWSPRKISEAANRVAVPKEWQGKGTPERNAAATGSSIVKKAQAMLNQRGFNVGTPDGLIGPKTKRAIMEFQRSAGIPVTGKVDSKLVEALGIQA
ncbi:MAG: peptidoglycan-binding protein [Pseudomonadota bacterium]